MFLYIIADAEKANVCFVLTGFSLQTYETEKCVDVVHLAGMLYLKYRVQIVCLPLFISIL